MAETDIRHLTLERIYSTYGATWAEFDGWRLPARFKSIEEELKILQTDCGVIDKSFYGRIHISGDTAQDFLHRMTSAPINDLAVGQRMETVVTTVEGRFVDWVVVYKPHEEHLTMVTGPGAAGHVIEHLQGYIFFKDDVHFQNTGDSWTLLQFSGPGAPEVLEETFPLQVASAENYVFHTTEIAGKPIYLAKANGITGSDYHLFCPKAVSEQVLLQLRDTRMSWEPVGFTSYDIARIRQGLPRYPNEITDQYTLVEAHLDTPLDLNSCFAGQEVIARTINYDKVKQHLCHVEITETLPDVMEPPLEIFREDQRIGEVTSLSAERIDGIHPGLGYVKTRYLDRTMDVEIEWNSNRYRAVVRGKTRSW